MIHTLVGIRPGVRFATGDPIRAFHPWGAAELGALAPQTLAALGMLQERVVPDDQLAELGAELVATLERAPFLFAHHVAWRGAIALSVTPIARSSDFRPRRPAPGAWLRLSRFAVCRRADRELVLESPLSFERIVLRSPELGLLLSVLARPVRLEQIQDHHDRALAPLIEAAVAHLLGAGAIESADDDSAFTEDRDEALRPWSFHDLLFHTRSRRGRHDHRYGAVYPFKEEIAPQPAVKAMTGPAIDLAAPGAERATVATSALDRVLEARRSIREYGAAPLSVEQLGDLLHRSARIRARFGAGAGAPYETTSRPYPAGGSCYELELYPIVARCRGLEPGPYHYDPLEHRLRRLPANPSDVTRMLRDAGSGMGRESGPDILIAITSRFQRVSWKYGSLAYALTLKNVGVLYQTMYLVATAMGVAACALGGGDSDLVAGALGLDYLREGCVGEFALGSLPERA